MITQEGRTSSQQSLEAERHLEDRLQQFDLWASQTDQSDDGWEGRFSLLQELEREAEQVMAEVDQSEHALFLLGRCWAITEEDETCADWAREHLQEEYVRVMVRRLVSDADPRTRWQACDVLGNLLVLDAATLAVLEGALGDDKDPYVRRRAFSALTRHLGGVDSQPYVTQMLSDQDSYNRYVAVEHYDPRFAPEALQDQIEAAAQDPEVARLLAAE